MVKGKHGGYGNKRRTRVICQDLRREERGSLCDAFMLFGDKGECFFCFVSLGDRHSDEETCVEGGEHDW